MLVATIPCHHCHSAWSFPYCCTCKPHGYYSSKVFVILSNVLPHPAIAAWPLLVFILCHSCNAAMHYVDGRLPITCCATVVFCQQCILPTVYSDSLFCWLLCSANSMESWTLMLWNSVSQMAACKLCSVQTHFWTEVFQKDTWHLSCTSRRRALGHHAHHTVESHVICTSHHRTVGHHAAMQLKITLSIHHTVIQ